MTFPGNLLWVCLSSSQIHSILFVSQTPTSSFEFFSTSFSNSVIFTLSPSNLQQPNSMKKTPKKILLSIKHQPLILTGTQKQPLKVNHFSPSSSQMLPKQNPSLQPHCASAANTSFPSHKQSSIPTPPVHTPPYGSSQRGRWKAALMRREPSMLLRNCLVSGGSDSGVLPREIEEKRN